MIGTRIWPFWAFATLLVILHFLLHLGLGLGDVAPDLLTVAVLLTARRTGGAAAAGLGLVLGVLRDSLSLVAFGADAVTLTLLGYLGARSRDLFVGESLLFVALYLLAGKWAHDTIYQLIAGPALGGGYMRLLVDAPLAALYAAAAGTAAVLVWRAVSGER